MPGGSIVLVHGTGARLKGYQQAFQKARAIATANGISQHWVECAWGDPLGVTFEGLSIPGAPSGKQQEAEEEDLARWTYLFNDPLFELSTLTIRDTSHIPKSPTNPSGAPPWLTLWEEISQYQPTLELNLLLERCGLQEKWATAWSAIISDSICPQAFEASAHELPDVCGALARALVAELHVLAVAQGMPGPSTTIRNELAARLLSDWNQQVYGFGAFLGKLLKRAATPLVRHARAGLSAGAALPVGDILLYQSRGQEIRDFLRAKIANAEPPVCVVAHSLGGIAAVDLLALPNPPAVARLVTAGSQAPLLFELGALFSLKPAPKQQPPYDLPAGFPRWLNFFDRNDFLSYIGARLFKGIEDRPFHSGQPFPDSHSAYFGDAQFWKQTAEFIAA